MLIDAALSIESDHGRVWEALKALADPEFVFRALTEGYGPDVAQTLAHEVRDVLDRAIAVTESSTPQFRSADGWSGRWVTETGWTQYEHALLAAAGRGLTRGLFVDEVCELIDRTDRVCAAQTQRLRSDGDQVPVSRVFAATYNQSAGPSDRHGLAASYVVTAFELAIMGRRFDLDSRPPGLAGRFAADANAQSWGRYYLALLALNPHDDSDRALFSSLLRCAWDAGGYHLQLQALNVAEYFGQSDEPVRSEILDVVRAIEPWHPFLAGSFLEVLSGFGEIQSPTTVRQLESSIRATLSHPDDIERCRLANTIVCNQFEDENLVGPYFEAVDELTREEKARLYAMAARGAEPTISMNLSWILDQLAELVPTGDPVVDNAARSVFADFLRAGPIEDAVVVNEAAGPCLAAVRGWAKFEATLPPAAQHPTPQQRNWFLVASLLIGYERQDTIIDPEQAWRALLLDPQYTVATLAFLDIATISTHGQALGRLVADYQEPMRELFKWALANPDDVPFDRLRWWSGSRDFAMRMLGAVGDESTAARLGYYVDDPEAGGAAVEAIRQIHSRQSP